MKRAFRTFTHSFREGGLRARFSRGVRRLRDRCRQALLSRLYADESGQATVEYILILSFSLVGAVAFARGFLATLDKGILTFGSELEKDLKTGRAQLDVWKN